ncbi:cupin domain-containing protein [Pedobacter gandavensis]|uniref:cupin domain-containing protein n=1 Tax=Pedobacter gandavensis TaxID=2679963 RepID=UPI002479D907|nr:cupin domain-containing protein [Pedobacter gandavensis]WGQ08224.1 cupin domain-containing protein [Pedobacter gandavensis]
MKISAIPRRIVTGIKNGRSLIVEDKKVTNVSEHLPGLLISDIWATNSMPVDLTQELIVDNTLVPAPPKQGSYFRYISIPPDKDLGIPEKIANEVHPLMHKTDTLDYIIILSGELYLILDEEETLLKTGDIVIQKGTNHAWSNRSDQPCVQLAILLDATK